MKYRILLAAILSMGGACVGSDAAPDSTRSAISACYDAADPSCLDDVTSGDPSDVVDICIDEHIACLEDEVPGELCDELLDGCFDVYDESDAPAELADACFEEAENCLDEGAPDELCFDVLDACLESVDEPSVPGEEGEGAEACFEGHIFCLEATEGDEEACSEVLDECLTVVCPPDEPEDPCLIAVEECIEGAPDGDAAAMCPPIADGCYEEEPDLGPCEEAFLGCIEAGEEGDMPGDLCEEILYGCEEPPVPCGPEAYEVCIGPDGEPLEDCAPMCEEPEHPVCPPICVEVCADDGGDDACYLECEEPGDPGEPPMCIEVCADDGGDDACYWECDDGEPRPEVCVEICEDSPAGVGGMCWLDCDEPGPEICVEICEDSPAGVGGMCWLDCEPELPSPVPGDDGTPGDEVPDMPTEDDSAA